MKFFMNLPAGICGLLGLSAVGFSLPRVIDVTAEDFVNMKEIQVRADGVPINQTGSIDIVCGGGIFVQLYQGTGYSTTLGWSLSLGVNSEFSSAGFSISESQTYSVSNTFTCNGVAAELGDIRVLFYQAVTAFTVDVKEVNSCACGGTTVTNRGQAIVYAPNSNQLGSITGRGINVVSHGVQQCVGDSDRTVHYYCGPSGGPEWWNGKGEGPWIADYVNERSPAGCAIPIEAHRYED